MPPQSNRVHPRRRFGYFADVGKVTRPAGRNPFQFTSGYTEIMLRLTFPCLAAAHQVIQADVKVICQEAKFGHIWKATPLFIAPISTIRKAQLNSHIVLFYFSLFTKGFQARWKFVHNFSFVRVDVPGSRCGRSDNPGLHRKSQPTQADFHIPERDGPIRNIDMPGAFDVKAPPFVFASFFSPDGAGADVPIIQS